MLPGVTVEARANVLPAPRVTTTGANGGYRLPALPPGAYTLTFVLSGMQNVTRQAEVQLSQDTLVDATLGLQGVTESVEVTATASLVEKDIRDHQERPVERADHGAPRRAGISRPPQDDSRRPVQPPTSCADRAPAAADRTTSTSSTA